MYSITRILKPLLLSLLGAILALSLGAAFWYRTALAEMVINAWQGYKLTDGLVGYWSFDGADMDISSSTREVFDRSGQGNHADWINHANTTAIGKIGQAVSFDGSDDYADIDTAPAVNASGNWAMSLWINTRAYTNGTTIDGAGTYFWDRTSGTQGLASLKAIGDKFGFQTRYDDGTGIGAVSSLTSIPLDTWVHVTVIRKYNSQFEVYINGKFENSRADAGSKALTLPRIRLAHHATTAYFNGTLDDVRVYNRALSAEEVKRLYLMGGSFKVNTSRPYEVAEGLLGSWTFDAQDIDWSLNKAFDRSGQGNNGTFTNMATTTAPVIGKNGQAINFDGTNDFLDAGDIAAIDSVTELTVCAWAKPGSISDDDGIVSKETVGTSQGSLLFRDDNGITSGRNDIYSWVVFDSADADTVRVESPANTTILGQWVHLCGTYVANSASGLRLYVDGVGVADNPVSTVGILSVDGGTGPFRVGSRSDGTMPNNGTIDDVRVYNRALSAEEVKRLYLMGGSFKINTSRPYEVADGLVGYWTFDGGDMDLSSSTKEVLDRSGQGNNGDWKEHATTTVIGRIGQGVTFDGSNDQVSGTFVGATDVPVSLCAWYKADPESDVFDNTADRDEFVTLRSASTNYEAFAIGIRNTSGSVLNAQASTLDNSAGSPQRAVGATNLWSTAANTWIHVCGVFTSTTQRDVYLNGVFDGTNAASKNAQVSNFFLGVGADSTSFGGYSQGTVDDVRIYNRALSAEEVKRLYLIGK